MSPQNPKMPSPAPPPPQPQQPPPSTTTSGHRRHHRPHPLPLPDPTLPLTPTPKLRSSRRSSSSLSSSSSSSSIPLSPTTPLHRFSTSAAVPFSWEHIPGRPKSPIPRSPLSSSPFRLPLPPIQKQSNRDFNKKVTIGDGLRWDPFLAALVKCSKDEDWNGSKGGKGSKRTGDRLGFLVKWNSGGGYSCKRSCGVVESIAFVGTATPRRIGYDLIEKRKH